MKTAIKWALNQKFAQYALEPEDSEKKDEEKKFPFHNTPKDIQIPKSYVGIRKNTDNKTITEMQ